MLPYMSYWCVRRRRVEVRLNLRVRVCVCVWGGGGGREGGAMAYKDILQF